MVNTATLCIAHFSAWSLNRLVAVVHVDNGLRNNLSSFKESEKFRGLTAREIRPYSRNGICSADKHVS